MVLWFSSGTQLRPKQPLTHSPFSGLGVRTGRVKVKKLTVQDKESLVSLKRGKKKGGGGGRGEKKPKKNK